jgi:hypothetical protein
MKTFEHYASAGRRYAPGYAKAGFNILEREPIDGMHMGYMAEVEVVRAPSGRPLYKFDVILNGPGVNKAKRKVSRALAAKYLL